ncbi:MAG: GC-type dockerin domain-anchored protein [Phycisphaerales bacterium]
MVRHASLTAGLLLLVSSAESQLGTYRVEPIAPFSTTTVLTGASEAGHVVGWQVVNGVPRAFVARAGEGISLLPMPPGHQSSSAMDVNSSGTVVGTSYGGSFPQDGGGPTIWEPDGAGGYTPIIPQQFSALPSPLGTLPVQGGQAVAINEAGTVVGWSRYQGFSGGPTTLFSVSDPPVNLQALGFQATVRDINNHGVIVGDGLRFDLGTNQVTELGVPARAGGVSFTFVIGYAINDSEFVVAAAHRATSTADRWLTYTNSPGDGWLPLDPTDLPTPNVGFYDLNNRGDVSATGGILFADEGLLVQNINALLHPDDAHWSVALGFIDDQRRFFTTAVNSQTNESFIVAMVPQFVCLADTNGNGELDPGDFTAWVTAYNAGDVTTADQNGNGSLDPGDFTAWVTNYNAGC